MAGSFQKDFVQDFRKDMRVRNGGAILYTGNENANTLTITLFDNGEPYAGGGTITGTAVRQDGRTVPLTGGSITGNVASVTLNQNCYNVPGMLGVYVDLVTSNATTTILSVIYSVVETATNETVDPSGEITISVTDLINQINQAVATVPPVANQLMAALAPTYDQITFPIDAGVQHCWYDGKFYVNTVDIASSESWTAAHWQETDVDESLADLHEAVETLTAGVDGLQDMVLIQTTQPTSDSNRVWIPTTQGEEVQVPTYAEHQDVVEDVDSLKSALGDPYVNLDQVEYTITNSLKFRNTAVGSAMRFQDNTTYHYILLAVTAGEKYKVTTYFTSADTYYIYMCDASDMIVSRDHNATDVSGSQTFDVEIPEGVTRLYIQGYSSAAAIAGRMNVQKYVSVSFRDMMDATIADVSDNTADIAGIGNALTQKGFKPSNLSFQLGFMNVDAGSVNTDNHNFIFSRGIQICNPVTISISGDGYGFAVNQYVNYNYSSTVFIKNWKKYNKNSVTIYADAYPIIIRIGASKAGDTEFTTDDIAAVENALVFKSLYDYPLFASIAMFDKFALTGCSWDAGSAYQTSDGHVSHTGIGWGEVLGRRNGCQVGNFAIGGSNIRSWFNNSTHASGFPALLTADAYPLYILIEGNSNDANAFELNDGSYSPTTPSTTKYYVGSIEDISTRQDYHDYPCTFYGYYGRVIEMIQAHAPNTRIIISSPDTTAITTDIRKALRTACQTIADYYGLPYMNIEKDPYYDTYVNAIVDGHPTAPIYSGWAMAIERLFADCVRDNLEYFKLYSGVPITGVAVAWEPVELP